VRKKFEYITDEISVDSIQKEIDLVVSELREKGDLYLKAQESGIEVEKFFSHSESRAIEARVDESGFDVTAIAVFFAPLILTVATDVWTKIVLPRLLERYGADAISEKAISSSE